MPLSVIVGGVLSMTLKVTVLSVWLPAASVALTAMECAPRPTSAPAPGLCVIVTEPQLSEEVLPETTSGITAWQLELAKAVEFAGTVKLGGVLSTTIITCVAVAVWP